VTSSLQEVVSILLTSLDILGGFTIIRNVKLVLFYKLCSVKSCY